MAQIGEGVEKADAGRRWTDQDAWALALKISLAILPSVLAFVAVVITLRLTPETTSTSGTVGWILFAAVVGFIVATISSKLTVRVLPLAALLRLSLVFPDQAPSRLKLAIRASSPKKLRAEVESARHHGLSSDTTEAAEQVLLLTAALGEHDRRTRGHSERVRLFARLLGEEMGIEGADLERLQWGALMHDIGKLTVPTEILNKPSKLDDAEWTIMSSHAAAGRDLAAPLHPFLGSFVSAADGHHERWDGTGYPSGLRGLEIPLPARIVAVADAYEVMTATRAYKKPMSAEAARAELTACAGTHFDPDVVRAWLNVSVGDVKRAAGPAAAFGSLPVIGELVALAGRTASAVATLPATVASAAPAAATAGAMTVAAVAAPNAVTAGPDLALDLRPSITSPQDEEQAAPSESSSTTAATKPSTSAPADSATNSSNQTTTMAALVSGANDPTTSAPSTTPPFGSATSSSSAPASQPTTTRAPTTAPSTTSTTTSTTAPPSPTSSPSAAEQGFFTASSGAALTPAGNLGAATDLTPGGPFADGSFLFLDPQQTLTDDVNVDGTTLAAGTVICVHLFVTSGEDKPRTWQLDFDREVLAVSGEAETLEATDFLQADGVSYGDSQSRALGSKDDVSIIRSGSRARVKIDRASSGSTRIFVDCAA